MEKSIITKAIELRDEAIASRILIIRGKRVILDADLSALYGVSTKALNQAVRRNPRRFPEDFVFQLNEKEKKEVVTNCDHLASLKFSYQLPYAFTEQGIAMLSSVLNSDRAIDANVMIMRVFVKFRELVSVSRAILKRLDDLENRMDKNDTEVRAIFQVIRDLVEPKVKRNKRKIGFHQ